MYRKELETTFVQIGNRKDETTGAVNAPIYCSTAYRHEGIGQSTGYDYSRTGNPTRIILEDAIAELEGGDRGFACSSGMAAIQVVLSLFESGDEIIASSDLYGGTYRLFEEGWKRWGLSFSYADGRDPETFRSLITEKTKALFIETPTNPLMHEADLGAVSKLAEENNLLLIVDNTFYTPLLQRPIKEGAHIVIHSASKYLAGHNDVIAGLIVTKGEHLSERLFYFFNSMGPVLSPLDSWLVMRGMKTLPLRMEKHQENARAVADYLRGHNDVSDVIYPGYGGMLSFRVTNEHKVDDLLQNLSLITFAESLGGVESLMTYPATQTHADIPEQVRNELGVCNRLLRFSVGIESAEDLIGDLDQAFKAVRSKEDC
ncbi:methionine biosynthesis PLP-dependent protein [Alteribacter keqinensis]|uniref:Methionine biosynthesis PLP-dependent protein n=1 Tax=Alteribacter keqinensis TaxID=2483800 RepID=A0A3M7TVA8_9BACI|nr:methionine biosynthesis PLP-dependent protein [Alteribacter keqinensis]RNA69383.1 methionine biosynthesis PLP-dependent protein [Alteribacter keqinensis]